MISIVGALTTSSVHHGSILPAARIIVLGVPLTFAFLFWFIVVRRKGSSK